jgi:DNA repair photolyase
MFRPIYEPRTRAREYCDLAVNIYTGCPHGCTYCYAPRVLRKKPEVFHADVRPRPGIVEAVKRQLAASDWKGQKIMLCFTCDPYPIGFDSTATREVIKAIKESGNNVQILTKGGETAQRDFDLLGAGDSFGITLTGGWREEPGAASEHTRIANLIAAARAGISTWVSCEPVYNPAFIIETIGWLESVDMWRIGKLNHIKSNVDWYQFGHQVEAMCKTAGRNFYIKEDLRAEMEKV